MSARRPRKLPAGLAAAILGVWLALACSSYSDDGTGPGRELRQAGLDAARAQWEDAGIESYRWTVRRGCFCPIEYNRPVIVRVERGVKTAVTDVETGEPVSAQRASQYPTVEGLFDIIQAAIDHEADRLEVSYDSAFGYPREVFIDQEIYAVDEEQTYEGSGLQPD
ncbi:MAG: DUF6174 domain-containing protein [Gemmatimonadota bacterium]